MKKIGLIVAVEIQSVLEQFKLQLVEEKECIGYNVYIYQAEKYQMIIVNCGVGEIAAASGSQFLISEFHVDLIINFGVAGSLTDSLLKTKMCIVKSVVHYDFDTSTVDNVEVGRYIHYPDVYIPTSKLLVNKAMAIYPELVPVICASADKFISDIETKRDLNMKFHADVCEMEAAGIVLTCNRNNIPCMLIKIISDSITGGAEEFKQTKDEVAIICFKIVNQIIKEL